MSPVIWRASPDGLEPMFRGDVHYFLDRRPETWYVLEALRSLERSAELYRAFRAYRDFLRGIGPPAPPAPRAAPPGESPHNFGLAVDVALDVNEGLPGLQPSWDVTLPAWINLRLAIIPHPRLSSGANFRTGDKDWPHIERFRWRRYMHWNR